MRGKKKNEKTSGKGTGKRGQTECIKLLLLRSQNKKANLELNEMGRPVGRYKSWFSSWLGRTAKGFIPCHVHAPKISEELRGNIWEEILSVFEFDVEMIDVNWVNHKLHKMHRDWRSILGTFIQGNNVNENVFEHFSSLKPSDWEKFKEKYTSDEFKRVSEKAKKSAASNDYPHNTSRGGYDLLSHNLRVEDWEKRKKIAEDNGDPIPSIEDVPFPDRSRLWQASRRSSSGEYYTSSCKLVGDKIDQYSQQESQGSFQPEGRNDVLAMAIGKKEHPGRVRGAGRGFTIKTYFGSSDSKVERKSLSSAEVLRRELGTSWVKYKEQQGEGANPIVFFDKVLSQWANTSSQIEIHSPRANHAPPIDSPQTQLSTPPLGKSTQDNVMPLFAIHLETKKLVAHGVVYPNRKTVHNQDLKKDEICVEIREVVVGFASLPLPIENVDIGLIGLAMGSFVIWPKKLVGEHGFVETLEQDKGDVTVEEIREELKFFDLLRVKEPKIWSTDSYDFVVHIPKEIFGRIDEAHFEKSDILDLLDGGKWLNGCWPQIAMLALHEKCKELDRSEVYFVSPMFVNDYFPERLVGQYLMERFTIPGSKILLSPLNIKGNHWILLVIFTAANEFIIFDPQNCKVNKGGITTRLRDYYTKTFVSSTGRNADWTIWKVPEQPGGWQCCYYVVRYMFEIVHFGSRDCGDSDDIKSFFTTTDIYTRNEFNEVKNFLAASLLKFLS